VQKYAAFGTLHHPIPVTQKNENPKLTKVQHLPLYGSNTRTSSELAWEESLHFHVHNTGNLQINNLLHTKNVPLQFNHAICAVQYNKQIHLPDYAGYKFFTALHLHWCSMPLNTKTCLCLFYL
jgi:hypothetical protein